MSDEGTPPPKQKEKYSTTDAAKDFAAGFLNQVQTRLELFSNELAEERARLEKIVLYGVMFVGTGIITMILITLIPFVWFDDEANKEYAFYTILGIYALVAVVSGLALRSNLKNRPKPFSSTIDEIRKDRDRLTRAFGRDSK